MKRRIACVFVFVGIAGSAAPALADVPRARCVEAYERAQYMRRESKLHDAREALLICAQDSCPAATRNDCVPWLAEVERMLPSVAVAPRDEQGHDLVDAKLSIDGAVQPGAATSSSPIIVDPGPHRLRVELPDGRFSEESIVVRAGEKSRVITLVVKGGPPVEGVVATAPTEGPPPPAEHRSIVLPVALTALGVAGLGVAVGVGVKAKADSEDLRTSCSPYCSSSDISAVQTKLLISDIGLGIGLVSLAVATYLWLRPSPTAPVASTAIARTGGQRPTTLVVRF